ncbi:N-acetylglucosamine kinase [Aquimarina sp. 2201CG1-2-11]|uniref:N-acetylglucosamine kinase n=1 Tax=Aquimarina discodermiae TaxID=3231043 RepID=UPI00346302A6
MILFADSGSTKCDWVMVKENGLPICKTRTIGINPLILSNEAISTIVHKAAILTEHRDMVQEIYFYGAGCCETDSRKRIRRILQSIFKNASFIVIEEDIIGAVKSTTQNPSVVCILGTGANCCYYDGKKVIQKSPALGYLLADEGSGNYLGKKLLKDYTLGRMPGNLRVLFKNSYASELDQLMDKLYNAKYPNSFLASFAQFIFNNRGDAYIEKILHQGISKFIDTYLFQYKEELYKHPLHFVGSIAYYSQDVLKKMVEEKGYQVKSFIKKPIDHLVNQVITQRISHKISQ